MRVGCISYIKSQESQVSMSCVADLKRVFTNILKPHSCAAVQAHLMILSCNLKAALSPLVAFEVLRTNGIMQPELVHTISLWAAKDFCLQ